MSTAIVFPGMGPTRYDESAAFIRDDPAARRMFAEAADVLGYSLIERFRDSASDYSQAAQVSFLITCLALAEWAEHKLGARPEVCAGPSFGVKVAAAYARVLDFAGAVRMTAEVARHTEEYFAEHHRDIVTHSFIRVREAHLKEILGELTARGAWHELSCRIDHDFVMLSLPERHLEWLDGQVRAAGGLSLYTMRPPMHAAAFAPLRERVEAEVFAGLSFADPLIPVLDDHDGTVLTTGAQVREMVLDGFVRAPSWPEVVASLRGLGVERIYLSGQDNLFGRVPITRKNFEVVPVNARVVTAAR